jgi:hypothetical protein
MDEEDGWGVLLEQVWMDSSLGVVWASSRSVWVNDIISSLRRMEESAMDDLMFSVYFQARPLTDRDGMLYGKRLSKIHNVRELQLTSSVDGHL